MSVDQPPMTDDDAQERFSRLEAMIGELQRELDQLRAERFVAPARQTEQPTPTGSRRSMLKMAGGMAAATLAGVVVGERAGPAAAATGDSLFVGKRNAASHRTTLQNGTTAGPVAGEPLTTERTLFWADNTASTLKDAIGIRADGRESGAGVDAYGGVGVRAKGVNLGVQGTGYVGVVGIGDPALGFGSVGVVGVALGTDERNYGVSAQGTTAALALSSQTKVPPPQRTDAHSAGEIEVDGDGTLWVCVEVGSPGTWRSIGATTSAGSLYAITPTRAYDSRWPGNGPLPAGASKAISVADGHDLGGAITSADVVPKGATAIAYNVTVTNTRGAGFLSVNPGSATTFASSSINWFGENQDIANGLIVALDDDREVVVFCGGGGTTDFVIDITGYFR